MSRWVGDPPLQSGVAEGIPTFPSVGYNGNAQPEGFVTEATIDLNRVDGAPPVSPEGTRTIYFRVRSGPHGPHRLPDPQQLVVGGCGRGGGSAGIS